MIKLFWILFPIALILLPLSKLKLNPTQSHKMRLRNKAGELGLSTHYAAHPQLKHQQANPQSAHEPLIRYQLSLSTNEKAVLEHLQHLSWSKNHTKYAASHAWLFEPYKQYAYTENFERQLTTIFNDFPSNVEAFDVSSEHIGCYWNESGDENDIANIAINLGQLKQLLLASYPNELYEKSASK